MRIAQHTLTIGTRGRGLVEITGEVARWVAGEAMSKGLLTLFCRHTSASLTIQENADPDVVRDLEAFFTRLVPDDPARYRHTAEGADDMPGHIRSALTDVQISVPVTDGRLALGTWQGLFLFEHRTRPHTRSILLHLAGE